MAEISSPRKPSKSTEKLRCCGESTECQSCQGEVCACRRPVGFHLEIGVGPTADLIHTIDGQVDQSFKYIYQGYGTAVLPIGDGVTVDTGMFVTHLAAEVIETNGNWNYSRSLLFAWAIPYFHALVRCSYPVTSRVSHGDVGERVKQD